MINVVRSHKFDVNSGSQLVANISVMAPTLVGKKSEEGRLS